MRQRHPARSTRRALPPSTASASLRVRPLRLEHLPDDGELRRVVAVVGRIGEPVEVGPDGHVLPGPPVSPRIPSIVRQIASSPGPGCGLVQPVGHEDHARPPRPRPRWPARRSRRGCTAPGSSTAARRGWRRPGSGRDDLVDLPPGHRRAVRDVGDHGRLTMRSTTARPASDKAPGQVDLGPLGTDARSSAASAGIASACPARSFGNRCASVSDATPRAASCSSRSMRPGTSSGASPALRT